MHVHEFPKQSDGAITSVVQRNTSKQGKDADPSAMASRAQVGSHAFFSLHDIIGVSSGSNSLAEVFPLDALVTVTAHLSF